MEETIENVSEFDAFDNFERRRKLLPWWVKGFCWLFMLFGVLSVVCLFLGFTNIKPDLSLYGFETNEPFSLFGLFVISIGILKGISAFSLWFEKDNAIKIGKIDAIIGIVLCVISMLVMPFFKDGFNITLRLELALLIPFLLKLNKIQKRWEFNRA
ncbi:hypothetical protein [Algibacter pectinivorans]|uniref:Uncharacterized protein n=1 Tax=Algibacter pectinivorans TaxID=870482 RepID=A0A1I1NIJ4_9FLAO|nr:hypothetical protein [Algibacter pectinivorans]SFC94563.1 hypothetical protein SAMN04487987_102137 [Algibacter pectinivorans]